MEKKTKKDLVRARVTSCPEILPPFVYRFVCLLVFCYTFFFLLLFRSFASPFQVNHTRNTVTVLFLTLSLSLILSVPKIQNEKCKSESDKLKAPTTKKKNVFLFVAQARLEFAYISYALSGKMLQFCCHFVSVERSFKVVVDDDETNAKEICHFDDVMLIFLDYILLGWHTNRKHCKNKNKQNQREIDE